MEREFSDTLPAMEAIIVPSFLPGPSQADLGRESFRPSKNQTYDIVIYKQSGNPPPRSERV
jgi:hypothetical protein